MPAATPALAAGASVVTLPQSALVSALDTRKLYDMFDSRDTPESAAEKFVKRFGYACEHVVVVGESMYFELRDACQPRKWIT